jgi:REP element-mobilizing transposase RayT
VRHDNFIPSPRYIRIHSRGRLPHWQVDEAVYFVTFRLEDSLPFHVVLSLKEERERVLREALSSDRAKLDLAFSMRLDEQLDHGHGSCVLRDYGELVSNGLRHFDGDRYQLHAWCVMPNHVHVLMHIAHGGDLPKIVHSWKSYTAHKIGLGRIWQREYFDRLIRSPQEFADTQGYIRSNPAKAGLRNWPWVG